MTSDPIRPLAYETLAPHLFALLLVAFVAFWPTYVSVPLGSSSGYTHAHAVTATLWMLVLIAQPMLIKLRRLPLHRAVGRTTYVIAPLVVLSILLLANHRIRYAPTAAYPIQAYILYLQLSLAAMFAALYALGVRHRRRTRVHARLMVCTALTLVDPIAIRVLFWIDATPSWNYQWLTFGLTDALLLALAWADRRHPEGRRLLLWVLAAFVATQLPALLGFTGSAAWQAFARWYAALPLT
jgi:hypothetical protein